MLAAILEPTLIVVCIGLAFLVAREIALRTFGGY